MPVESILVANAPLDAKALNGGKAPKLSGPVIRVSLYYVGEGEAILISSGKRAVLIDGGSDSNKKRNDSQAGKTFQKFPKQIQLGAVIASHPHRDHTNFYPYLLKSASNLLKPSTIYYDNGTPPADRQWDYLQTLAPNGLPFSRTSVDDETSLKFASEAYLLRSQTKATKDESKKYWSVFLLLRHNNAWLLFTGDAMKNYEESILPKIEKHTNRVHMLKITHHGSESGTSPKLVNRLNPSIAVSSSNADEGHRLEPVTRETLHVARVFATYEDWGTGGPRRGDIEMRTDGKLRKLGGINGILFEVERRTA